MLSLLREPAFRNLFLAQAAALVGSGLATVALSLLAYQLAGGEAGAVLGTALALKMVAYIVIAPVVGGLAHRLPRKAVLVILDVARLLLMLCLPWVDAVWQIYLVIFLLSACSACFTPLFQTTIPDVLPDERRYTRALSLSRLAYDLEVLVSPVIAAFVLLFAHYNSLFAANAATFLVSGILLATASVPPPGRSDRPRGVFFNLIYGLRVYAATPRLRGVLMLSLAVAIAGAMVIVNTVVYVGDSLGGSETETAIAWAAAGAGSMLAAIALPRLLERYPPRTVMLWGAVVLAPTLAMGSFYPGYFVFLVLWFVIGVGMSLVQTPIGRVLVGSCRPADRPALFSAHFALSHAGWLVAYPLAGWIGSEGLMSTAFLSLAIVALLASAGAALAWPPADPVELEHEHETFEHEHSHVHDEHHDHTHDEAMGPEPHSHRHVHANVRHEHAFVIDLHHPRWP